MLASIPWWLFICFSATIPRTIIHICDQAAGKHLVNQVIYAETNPQYPTFYHTKDFLRKYTFIRELTKKKTFHLTAFRITMILLTIISTAIPSISFRFISRWKSDPRYLSLSEASFKYEGLLMWGDLTLRDPSHMLPVYFTLASFVSKEVFNLKLLIVAFWLGNDILQENS